MKNNLILMGDSYKYSHFLQYPEGTETVYSYIEARGSKEGVEATLFFGLQAFIQEYLTTPITMEDVLEAKELIEAHGEPFNFEGWKHIVEIHKGMLPIQIEAVPEGSVVELSNVLVQVHNTDSAVPWLTSFIETALLRAVWYPTTVATNSYLIKQDLLAYAEKSGSVEGVDFKLHDFGARGVSSHESAMLGGMGHLVNFMGTDNIEAIVGARRYYDEPMAGFSIPAAEHSTITVWGEDNEAEAYRNMLTQFAKPNALVAVVSDSYDINNAVNNIWGKELYDEVISSGATVIIRPDSGDPTMVPIEVIDSLMNSYGYEVNEDGYKTLPSCIRVIQGDGIDRNSIKAILANMEMMKFSLDNLAFGMGGALLQHMNRDTFQFAMKACYAVVDHHGRDVFKRPVGDMGKASKAGILQLNKVDGQFITVRKEKGWNQEYHENFLKTVFLNGIQPDDGFTFAQVREFSNL